LRQSISVNLVSPTEPVVFTMASLKSSPAWKALEAHREKTAGLHMRDLFAGDKDRLKAMSVGLGGLFLDYSKNRVSAETCALLIDLAREADVEGWRGRMATGENINTTEGRPALHMALRDPGGGNGEIIAARKAMERICNDIRDGKMTGATGKPFQAVVHIGAGGSHLGPAMVVRALKAYRDGPDIRFVCNVDGAQIAQVLDGLVPETTLFIAASKSFTTEETLTNARTAYAWLSEGLGETGGGGAGEAVGAHFIAVTANAGAAGDFGIGENSIIALAEGVGGRFSVCSGVGLAAALAVGWENFAAMLSGAHDMDRHFMESSLDANMPVILGAIGIWNIDFLGAEALAILPYDEGLGLLPAYLRQLEMESNGKSTGRDGTVLDAGGAPIVFGQPGTGGQHAFYQAIHQGRRLIASDFIVPLRTHHPIGGGDHHQRLLANAFAQSQALMTGRDSAGQPPHRAFEGNRPSNTILMDRVDPFTLGQLIALYEHKVFVQAVIWGINPFDQWGVELGKELAAAILPEVLGRAASGDHDCSTRGLIARARKAKEE
jgi:glucose-6-phosphate isomerase|tara:strand:+ start:2797 stop:4443 length:1647 start_codon:yes stop_codon:yes gene_type:complete